MSTVLHPGHEQLASSLAKAMSGHVELTVADLPENTEVGVRLELIDGSLYVNALADFDHQDLVSDLVARLRPVTPEGMRVLAGVNVIDGPSTLVEPDVAVVDPACVTADRRGVSPAGVLLAVEVTSRSTRRRDFTIKRDLYQGWSVPYLLVDRSTRPFTLHVAGSVPAWAKPVVDGIDDLLQHHAG